MSDICFRYYKVPDPMDNVCDLANEMIFTQDIRNLVKDVYSDFCFESIEMSWVLNFLEGMNIKNAKIVVSGKDILGKIGSGAGIKTEKWFKTKYSIIDKNTFEISKQMQ
jgi:hypothetical protein